MMRVILSIVLSLFMTSCGARSYNPEAQVDIHAAADAQAELIEVAKAYGRKNGFVVHAGSDLLRGDRRVSQLRLEGGDGTVIGMTNFMSADAIQTFFYAEKPSADWRSVKAAWLEEMRVALDGRGEIIEVPVGPPPSLVEEERNRREAAKPEDR